MEEVKYPKKAEQKNNIMREIKISQISLNIGAGKDENKMKKAIILLQKISNMKPIKTTSKKRIPGWGLRVGLPIGCKVTIRKNTSGMLKRLLAAKENILSMRNFDTQGNFSFGIPEYIDIEGMEYDPELKIMGLEVAVGLSRPGFRIKNRKNKTKKIDNSHKITKDEAIAFVKEKFGVKVQ